MNLPKLLRQAGAELGAGNVSRAESILKKVLKKHPDQIDALNLAGLVAYEQGNFERAAELLTRVVRREPNRTSALLNLGVVANCRGDFCTAERYYRTVVQYEPNNVTARANLGKNFLDQNKLDEALECLSDAVRLDSRYWIAQHNLGTAYQRLGNIDIAIQHYQHALNQHRNAESLGEMIACLRRTDRFDEELELAKELIAMPNTGDSAIVAWESLFDAHEWDLVDATASQVLAQMADSGSRPACVSTGLLLLNSLPDADETLTLALHRSWGDKLPTPTVDSEDAPSRDRAPGKLRVGYLSPDFREHSVGLFLQHILPAHNPQHFDVFCYANQSNSDPASQRIADAATSFRHVDRLSDDELAQVIHDDQLDVLIDLSAHTRDSRVAVMKARLAPVQATYLGYPNTTGLTTVDYRISDPYVDTTDARQYVEELVRLPESFLCFGQFDSVPIHRPTANGRPLTFGCFNNVRKITPQVVRAWVEILKQVPDSRLTLKSRRADTKETRANIERHFIDNGVDPARLVMRGPTAERRDHLAAYNDIDIALDCFPYNGTTTTCEALWMGVPVVGLIGEHHAERVTYSILNNIGHADLCADSIEAYIAKATELARDRNRLDELHQRIATDIRGSVLCDPARFMRQFEQLLTQMSQQSGKVLPLAAAG